MAAISPGKIFNKAGSDKTLILSTRAFMLYPFEASNWTDLRVGFFLSLTQLANDDTTTGLAEVISASPNPVLENGRYWIGLKTNNYELPLNPGVGFIGYTNCITLGDSRLVPSDASTGNTPPLYFWRAENSLSGVTAQITDGPGSAGEFDFGYMHFPEDPVNAGGYATLVMIRITRPNSTSNALTVSIKQTVNASSDILFTSNPSAGLLESHLYNYPSVVQTHIAYNMANIPDALYLYWPFLNSRLRCHALGVVTT